MMDNINRIAVLVKVVETGSFSKAASELHITKSAVSKHIQALEDQLGARLLNRTTRRLNLTEAGKMYVDYASSALEQLREAERRVHNLHDKPSGRLRINAPVSFGILHLADAIADFAVRYPDIQIDVDMNDHFVDIIEEGFDVAVRISKLVDSSMIARKISPIYIRMCASSEYLKKYGTPKKPEDLAKHRLLEYSYRNPIGEWHYEHKGQRGSINFSSAFYANNAETLRQAAVKGLGIAAMPLFVTWQDLEKGHLKLVMPEYNMEPGRSLYALYPHNRHLSAKVRVFVDFLVERFSKPYWQQYFKDKGIIT